jgi:hypothetical protein
MSDFVTALGVVLGAFLVGYGMGRRAAPGGGGWRRPGRDPAPVAPPPPSEQRVTFEREGEPSLFREAAAKAQKQSRVLAEAEGVAAERWGP